jgi:hypothetical protein
MRVYPLGDIGERATRVALWVPATDGADRAVVGHIQPQIGGPVLISLGHRNGTARHLGAERCGFA